MRIIDNNDRMTIHMHTYTVEFTAAEWTAEISKFPEWMDEITKTRRILLDNDKFLSPNAFIVNGIRHMTGGAVKVLVLRYDMKL